MRSLDTIVCRQRYHLCDDSPPRQAFDGTLHLDLDQAVALANCLIAGGAEPDSLIEAARTIIALDDIQAHESGTLRLGPIENSGDKFIRST